MKTITIKGDVVSDATGKLFDWFDLDSIYPQKVKQAFDNLNGDDVEVIMTTNGGSVFSGQEIYDIIKNYSGKTKLKISGLVASIGTLISCAFDDVYISPVATFMIHNPTLGDVSGEKSDMEKAAQLLETVERTLISAYVSKTGMDESKISELMAKETFMTAQETVDNGFADGLIESESQTVSLVAGFNLSNSAFIEKLQKLKDKEESDLATAEAKARLRLFELEEKK